VGRLDREWLNQRARAVRMKFGSVVEIEDLGNHHTATVLTLGILLAGPVDVTPDPKRKGFYEVEGGATTYYIYVSPVSRTVSLLACWKNVMQPMPSFANSALGTTRTVENAD
jgi:hypothetical protein